jgi:23S rRNA pseudouridine2605 synthase
VRELQEGKDGKHEQAILEMTIREGRNRQVRKMCEAVGHPVFALRRTRIGPIADPKLPLGAWRDLTPREVAALQRVAGSLAAAHEPPPQHSITDDAPSAQVRAGRARAKQPKHRRLSEAVFKKVYKRKVR